MLVNQVINKFKIIIHEKDFLALGCFMVFGIGTVNAQNVLNEMAYGFETEVKRETCKLVDSTCTKGQGDGY